MESLLNFFLEALEDHNLLQQGDKIIIGVSGGPDSMCLLKMFLESRKRFNLKLVAAHVNYKSRGKDSELDEKLVCDFCRENNLNFKVFRLKEKLPRKNFEENARKVRYDFFNKLREDLKMDKIAVAQTEDDQVETIFIHFLRGSGIEGLGGMNFQSGNLIRPLLDISRKDILSFLKSSKISYRIDKSNADVNFLRNKIRHRLLPLIIDEYNPQIKENLVRLSYIAKQTSNFIEKQALKEIKRRFRDNRFPLKHFLSLSSAIQTEILRQLLGKKDLSFVQIQEIIGLLSKSEPGKRKIVKKGLTLRKERDSIVLQKEDDKS